jgi:hypothetical protein
MDMTAITFDIGKLVSLVARVGFLTLRFWRSGWQVSQAAPFEVDDDLTHWFAGRKVVVCGAKLIEGEARADDRVEVVYFKEPEELLEARTAAAGNRMQRDRTANDRKQISRG